MEEKNYENKIVGKLCTDSFDGIAHLDPDQAPADAPPPAPPAADGSGGGDSSGSDNQ
jgi:hypothetical protein